MKKGKKHTSCDRNFLTCLISHFCQCISQQEANLPLIPMLLKDFLDDLLKLHFSNNIRGSRIVLENNDFQNKRFQGWGVNDAHNHNPFRNLLSRKKALRALAL